MPIVREIRDRLAELQDETPGTSAAACLGADVTFAARRLQDVLEEEIVKRGRPRDVLDRVDWVLHCQWVRGLCGVSPGGLIELSTLVSFRRSPAAERGRLVCR